MARSYRALGRNVIGTWRSLLAELAQTMAQVMRRTRSRAQDWTRNDGARRPGRRGYLQSLRGLGLIGSPVEALESRLLLSVLPYDLIANTTYMDATGHYRASGYSTHLTWQENSSPDSFTIQRQMSGGNWVQVASLSNLSPSADGTFGWDDTNVAPATTYTYRVANTTTPTTYSNADVVRTLRGGDAQGDGVITAVDFAQLDASYLRQQSNPTWLQGDFNHDNAINSSDFTIIDAAFQNQQGAVANPWLVQTLVQGPHAVKLTWYDGAASVTVYRSDGSVNADGTTHFVPLANGTGIGNTGSYTDNTAAANSTYIYMLTASDGIAQSGYSSKVRATTPVDPLAPPNNAPVGTSGTITTRLNTAYVLGPEDFGFTDPSDSPANRLLAVKITSLPSPNGLTINGNPVTLGQFINVVDLNNGGLKFVPVTGQSGWSYASFTFQVQDNGGTAGGGSDLSVARTLTINVSPIQDAVVETVARSALQIATGAPFLVTDLSRLTTLSLDSSQVSSLAGLRGATNLTSLVLTSTNVAHPGGLHDLSPLTSLTHLQTLVLQGCGLVDADLTNSNLTWPSSLHSLDLRYNGVTTIPASVAILPNLGTLQLYGNPITNPSNDPSTPGNPQSPSGLLSLKGKPINLDLTPTEIDGALASTDSQMVGNLARALYYNPLKIYEWVLNNIKYDAYFGNMKSPAAVIDTKIANDWDTASLLTALLHESGVATTRYKYGAIGAPVSQVQQYLGVMDPQAIEGVLNVAQAFPEAGNSLNGVFTNTGFSGSFDTVLFYHVWVEAQFTTSGSWLPLDASWKFRDFQSGVPGLTNILSVVPFDSSTSAITTTGTILHEYLSQAQTGAQAVLASDYYEQKVRDYLAQNYPAYTLADLAHDGPIHPQVISTLPTSTPYNLFATPYYTNANIPANLAFKVQVSLTYVPYGGSVNQTYFNQTLDLPTYGRSKIAVVCPLSSPTGTRQPKLTIDDTIVASGAVALDLAAMTLNVTSRQPTWTGTITNPNPWDTNQLQSTQYDSKTYGRTVGQNLVVGLDATQITDRYVLQVQQQVNEAALAYADQTPSADATQLTTGMLYLAVLKYFNTADQAEATVAGITGMLNKHDLVASGVTTGDNTFQTVDAAHGVLQLPFLPLNMGIDVPSNYWDVIPISHTTPATYSLSVNNLLGLTNSSEEHSIWEELANIASISIVKSFQLNIQQDGGQFTTVHNTADLAGIHFGTAGGTLDTEIKGHITGYLTTYSGSSVFVPNVKTPLNNWDGVGYLIIDAQGEYLGFIIDNGISAHGGYTTWQTPNQVYVPPTYSTPSLGDPINLGTGSVQHDATDIQLPASGLPLNFSRSYDSLNTANAANPLNYTTDRGMGPGWSFSYSDRLEIASDQVIWFTGSGERITVKIVSGVLTNPAGIFGTLAHSGSNYTWTDKTGGVYKFLTINSTTARLESIKDRYGNGQGVTYAGPNSLTISTVSDLDNPSHTLNFAYDGVHYTQITDSATGRSWQYVYGDSIHLTQMKAPQPDGVTPPWSKTLTRAKFNATGLNRRSAL